MANTDQKTLILLCASATALFRHCSVVSTLAALMLWSSSVDSPSTCPSMCMKNQVTPLTCLSSHHLDGCSRTQQGWSGCIWGMGSRQSSPGFVSIEAGRSLGKKLHPSTLSYSTSQCLLLPSMKKGFSIHPVFGQYSEPTGVICTLLSAGKEEILGPVSLQAKLRDLLFFSESTL